MKEWIVNSYQVHDIIITIQAISGHKVKLQILKQMFDKDHLQPPSGPKALRLKPLTSLSTPPLPLDSASPNTPSYATPLLPQTFGAGPY